MALLRHTIRPRPVIRAQAPVPPPPVLGALDELLKQLQPLLLNVPCAGCGGAHEMTAAEVIARQLIRGSGWDSEECDETVTLGAVLSPDDVMACNGDTACVRQIVERRGYLQPESVAPSVCSSRDRHHVLLPH